MYERNDPQLFYTRIRPFLAGTRNAATLPNGVFYENESGGGTFRAYNGPTAAQSSLMQFIDIALGVQHHPTGLSRNLDQMSNDKKLNALEKNPEFLKV